MPSDEPSRQRGLGPPERRWDARQALSLGSSFVPHLGQKSHSSITQPSGGCVCQARAAMAAATEVAGTRRRSNLALVCSIGVERGQVPHHLLGLALWTSRPASDVLTHPLRLRELLAACFAVILVGWHTFLLRVKSGDSHATISSVVHWSRRRAGVLRASTAAAGPRRPPAGMCFCG